MPSAVRLNVVTDLYLSSRESISVNESEGESYVSTCSNLKENVIYVSKVDLGVKILSVYCAVLGCGKLKTLVSADRIVGYMSIRNTAIGFTCVPSAFGFKIIVNVFVCVFCSESNILGNGSTEVILYAVLLPSKECVRISGIEGCGICRNGFARLNLNYGILLRGSIIKGNAVSENVIVELQYERAVACYITGNACFLRNVIFYSNRIGNSICICSTCKSLGAVKLV